jgi:ABC-2 type transport system ATP-binding protein
VIEVRRLRKEYGTFLAVDDIDLDVPAGAVLALVGPNGAGKTTLMKMIAGLLAPTSGTSRVAGFEHPKDIHRKLGFLPDFFGLYDDLTVREYLEYFARAYGLDKNTRKERVDAAIAAMMLEPKADSFLQNLSRGQRQRAGIARTLINDPPVILLDEPASGLDPEARHELQELFLRLAKMGKTLVVSSHILTELEEYCSHVAMIQKGKLVAAGAVHEIRSKTAGIRRAEVRVLARVTEALTIVREAKAASDATSAGEFVTFGFNGDDSDLAEILRSLVNAGIPVVSFGADSGKIQDTYLSLMKGHSE